MISKPLIMIHSCNQSSFSVMHKVGNVGIFELFKFENTLDREIRETLVFVDTWYLISYVYSITSL